jgi:hypothetical protein
MRLKDFENKGVRIDYWNKLNDLNTIHGKLTYVSKERIIVMVAVESTENSKEMSFEHVINRKRIKHFEPIKYSKHSKTE